LLVPPEKEQLNQVKGDKRAYDSEPRPRLMVQTIQELQDAEEDPMCRKSRGSTAANLWTFLRTPALRLGLLEPIRTFGETKRKIRGCLKERYHDWFSL
jgi:hypothetical protein